ncbi:Cof-type HAD-IIB family hydrolase [Ammoniphilus sp. CFH 90114]|uniref:Cof-type HAD-IIB family hydrolase n=1 Tax=Ammoniphilus sp. CFH 90114 TaxID=2493665 RepID=UPI00100E266C|nr:Cof-type HAD-IIB family hydrolase [Ammoniphilus sp. CFH 90114]RXT03669.1 Cof-type HAD-IIB family hydrolase [Ammoniphilus sp. CFH 90114]
MKIKLIATDLDGTLLKNNNSIDSETTEFLIKFQSKKGILVLITGRRLNEISEYIDSLKMLDFKTGYIVFCDGQYVWDISNNQIINNQFLTIKDVIFILDHIKNYSFNVTLYNNKNDFVLLNKQTPLKRIIYSLCRTLLKKNGRKKYTFTFMIPFISSQVVDIEKVVIHTNKLKSKDMHEYFGKFTDHFSNYNITLMEEKKIEISRKNVNKRDALLQITNSEDLLNDDVLVIGDEGNDVKMLKYFKNSFAMGNASNYVKQAAMYITDTNENQGVLKALKKFVGDENDRLGGNTPSGRGQTPMSSS